MVAMWVLLLVGLIVLAALVAGVTLLIVGLARRRTGVWVAGVVLGVVSVAAMVAGIGLAVRKAVQARRTVFLRAATAAAAPIGWEFEECTGVPLPDDAVVTWGMPLPTGRGVTHFARLEVPEGFRATLERDFTPASWDDVKDHVRLPGEMGPIVEQAEWGPADVKTPRCYRKTHADEFGMTYESYLVYDADEGCVHFAAEVPAMAGTAPAPDGAEAPASVEVGE